MRRTIAILFAVASIYVQAQVTSLPWQESFTGYMTLPSGWDNSEYGNPGYSSATPSLRWNVQDEVLHFLGHNVAATWAAAKTPAITLPNNYDATLMFRLKNPMQCGSLGVYVSTDGGVTYLQNPLDSNLLMTEGWVDCSLPLAAYRGQQIQIVFYARACQLENIYYTEFSIDDIEIDATPICKVPINLGITGLSDTAATLMWDLGSDGTIPSQYQFQITDGAGYNVSQTLTTHYSHTLGNLTPNTQYTVTLRSDCSASSKGYSRYSTMSFTTLCQPQGLPYSQDFENTSHLPSCCIAENCEINTVNGTLKMSAGKTEPAMFVTPRFTIPADSIEISLKIKRANTNYTGKYHIGIISDPTDIGTFTSLIYDSLATGTDWADKRVNTSLVGYTTGNNAVCIMIESGDNSTVYVDDLTVRKTPTCIRPENLTASNIGSNSATVTWNATGAAQYRVTLIGESDTTYYAQSSNSITFSGLTPNRDYRAKVRAICSASDSSDISSETSFHILCAPATTPYFSEGFETSALPECWSSGIVGTPQETPYPFSASTRYHHSGSQALSLPRQAAGNKAYISTTLLPLTGNLDVALWIWRDTQSDSQVGIWATTTAGDTTGGALLGTISALRTAAPAEAADGWYMYQFPITVSGNRYITVVGTAGSNALYIDDLAVIASPTCRKVSGINATAQGSTAANVRWTPNGTATQFRIECLVYSGTSTVQSIQQTVNIPQITISGLTAGQYYNLAGKVTALCTAQDTAEAVWFNLFVQTPCTQAATLPLNEGFEANYFPPLCWQQATAAGTDTWYVNSERHHSGAHSAFVSSHSQEGRTILATPRFTLNGTPSEVKFNMFRGTENYSMIDEALYVYLSATESDTLGGTLLGVIPQNYSVAPSENTPGWHPYTFSFPATTAGDRYLLFVYHSQGGSGAYIDDITVRNTPSCGDIQCEIDSIASTSAVVVMTTQGCTTWQYMVDANPPVTVNDSTARIANLVPQTTYQVKVRRVCGSSYGEWSDQVEFTTACNVVSLPYIEDFETTPSGTVPGCIASENYYYNTMATATATSAEAFNHTEGGSKGLTTSVLTDGTLSPGMSQGGVGSYAYVHLEAGTDYEYILYTHKSPATGQEYNLTMYYGATPDHTRMTKMLVEQLITSAEWEEMKVYFSVPATGDYYVGFYVNAPLAGVRFTAYIDDISLRQVACVPPTATFVASQRSTSADIAINAAAGARWEIAVSDQPITPSATLHGNIYHNDNITTTLATIPGLQPSTTYFYTVRTVCQSGASAWLQPQRFTTRCGSVTIPYSNSFEEIASAGCWTNAGRTTAYAHSGIASVKLDNATIISPEFADQLTGHTLTAWVYAIKDSTVFSIGAVSDPDDVSTFEQVGEVTIPYANRWQPVQCRFDNLSDTAARHIGMAANNSSQYKVYIDDVNIDVTPHCAPPTNMTVSATTTTTVTLGWDGQSPSLVKMTPTEGGASTIAVCQTSPATIQNLMPSTTYAVRMASICGADTSDMIQTGYATTACGTLTAPYAETFEHQTAGQVPGCWDISASSGSASAHPEKVWNTYEYNGNRMIRLYNSEISGASIIRSPMITLPAGRGWQLDLDYSHKASCGNFYVRIFRNNQVVNLKTIAQGSVDNLSSRDPGTMKHVTIDLTAYAGQTVQLQFNTTANNQSGAIFVDNIAVSEIMQCKEPTVLTLSAIGETEATITVTDTVASHTQWEYVVGEKGIVPEDETPLTSNSKTISLSQLQGQREYEIAVRTSCGAGNHSNWCRLTFKTTATPATVPYSTDFTSATDNTRWAFQTMAGSGSSLLIGSNSEALLASPQALYVSPDDGESFTYLYDKATSTNAYRSIALGDSIYKFDISYSCTGGISSTDYARIYLIPASLPVPQPVPDMYRKGTYPAACIALDGNGPIYEQRGWQHISKEIDLRGRAGVYNIVFTWVNDTNSVRQTPLTIGYVGVDYSGCPESLTIAPQASETTATIKISGSSNYEYRLAHKGSPEAYEQAGTSTSATLTLTGLQHSTEYHLFVRNICTDGTTSVWEEATFQTECGANTTYPFVETFADMGFPPTCWEMNSTRTGVNWDGTPIEGSWVNFSSTMPTDNYCNTQGAAELRGYNGSAAALATPLMHLDSGREYHLSFYCYRMTRSTALAHVTVYLSKTAYPDRDAIALGDYTNYDPTATINGPRLIDIDIPADIYGDYRIVFEGFYVGTTWIVIDDVIFDEYPPCRAPLTPPTIVETSSTTISAEVDLRGKPSVRVVIAPFTPGQTTIADTIAGTATTDGNVTFTGLTPGTTYALYARTECSDEEWSEWTAMARAATKADECFAPDGLRIVGEAGPTSVTVTYGVAADAVRYDYILTSSSDTLGGTTMADTMTFAALTPSTDYTLRVRTMCQTGDSTAWSTIRFRTLGAAVSAPYQTGFENAEDNAGWEFAISGSYNNFVISGANEGHKDGNYGLYISNDHSSYSQSVPASSDNIVGYNIAYAMRTIWLEPGIYEAAFDWRCDAYVPGQYFNPYFAVGRAFLTPASTEMTGDAMTYLYCNPEGSVELFRGNMDDNQTWSHSVMTADVKKAGYYKITFGWQAYNTGSATSANATAFPLAIDNLSIEEVSCRPPYSLSIAGVRSTTIDVVAHSLNTSDYEYGVALCETPDSIVGIITCTSDTMHLTGLTPKTHYYIYVRHTCTGSDKSPWRVVEATTNATEATVPYICQFADMNENSNWIIACTGMANYFTVGNGVVNNSGQSLYVTNNGTDNQYDLLSTSTAYAYRTITLDTGYYDVMADWRAYGRFTSDLHAYDFGRLILVPASVEITDGLPLAGLKWDETPSNAIALDNGKALINQGTWETMNNIIRVDKSGDYNIVAYWYNQNQPYGGANIGNPPIAFDNISVTECLCSPIQLRLLTVGDTTASIYVSNSNAGAPIRYTLSNIDSPFDALVTDTVVGDTLRLNGLSPSSTYYIYAQAVCSEADSRQARIVVHTNCGTITTLPYCEGFESFALANHIDNLSTICWSTLNVDAVESATPYYGYLDNSNYVHSGVRAARLHPSSEEPLIFVLPDFGDITDVAFSFWYRSESSTLTSPMKIGYVTDILDATSFVELQQFGGTMTFQRYSQSFIGAPAGARIALSYGGTGDTHAAANMDDIRVSRLIHSPELRDTICYGVPYIGNGFNVQANKLHAGDNILNRVKLSPTDNGNDTLYTTLLYVQPQIHTDFFDTCCANHPFVKGEWNIPTPVSGSYVHNYSTATGCDSAVILYLQVLPASNAIIDTICTGTTYLFHGRSLTLPGMYVDSALNRFGCMTIDTLYLMVMPDTISNSVTVCSSALPYQFHGQNLTQSGTYYEAITGPRGCAQTDMLILYVVPTDTFYSETICQGGYYLFIDTVITTAGTYIRHRINPMGCDMTHHLTVTVNHILTGDAYDYVCEGKPYSGNGITGLIATQDTVVDVTTKNGMLCDSLTHVHLTFVETKYGEEYKTISKGEVFNWHDNTYSQPGDYQARLTTAEGCDSIATLHLSVIDGDDILYGIDVSVVPNPVRIGETAYLTGEYEQVESVEVLNSLGQVVQKVEGGEIRGLPSAGVYVIRITFSGGKTTSEKLIVR